MFSKLFWGLLLALLWSLAFCSSSQEKGHGKPVLLTIDELAKKTEHVKKIEITLKKEPPEDFVIVLESQPGTGYAWRQLSNSAPVKLTGAPLWQNKDNKPGGISDTIFPYTATSRGSGVIEYEYRQEWEKNDPHAKKLKVEITIK